MAATDAGGQLALRHGTMRAQVAGLEAVLADGTILERLGGPAKDNAGYDLSQLIVGSEGTLAIITAVRIRLIARPRHRVSALCGVAGIEEALLLLEQLRKGWGGLEAADFFETRGLELLMEHRGLRAPLQGSHGAYLVADLVGEKDPSEALLQILDGSELECETTAGQSTSERAALWAYRELLNEAVASAGVPRKFDVSVPVAAVAGFAEDVHARVAQLDPDARVILYGHLGDGNVHVNVLGAEGAREAFDEGVLALAASYGGSISAEHGVGVAKAAHLPLIRSPGEIEAMRAIKRALDPHWILNPGCVLAAPERDER